MKIEHTKVKLKDLHSKYLNSGYAPSSGDDLGIVGYGGNLNIRPKYQRSYVYNDKDRDAVIETILKEYPLNVMYWAVNGNDKYEVIDGQQRTISICEFMESNFSLKIEGKSLQYDGLAEDIKNKFDNYELDIYLCDGSESEKLAWFKTINIAGKVLTKQELNNAVYTGDWLTDAKKYFSRRNQGAHGLSQKLIAVDPDRQGLLELALEWITDKAFGKKEDVTKYMSLHKSDSDATELRNYFAQVIAWVNSTFPNYRLIMKGQDWGIIYNAHKNDVLLSSKLEAKIKELVLDDEVQNKKGIYRFVLDANEKWLNLRDFPESQKLQAYEIQNGVCKKCSRHFEINEMEADHITPWSQGGKTNSINCQVLCRECNRRKSNK